jgi:3-oxoacyl-[acyl-carrier-protein] synthase-1
MEKIFITGIGYATSIGHTQEQIDKTLREGLTGLAPANWAPEFKCPVKLWAPVKGFDTSADAAEDWTGPNGFSLPMDVLRSIPPSGFYSFWSVSEALKQAGLERGQLSDGRTGLYSASAGSVRMTYRHMRRMYERGVMSCSPMGVLTSAVGTLNFNLGSYFKISGYSCGFASACASSGHALGFAFDALRSGAQDRMIVLGAEDDTPETILPFATMRVLSMAPDVAAFHGPFDAARGGFVGTGGAVAFVLERETAAAKRAARPLAVLEGWGQATDGYHPAKPHPEGAGLLAAMKNALAASGRKTDEIDYINAHATGTSIGDLAELKALNALFPSSDNSPTVSSTKGLTGHGLSLASILELSIAVWAVRNDIAPGNFGLQTIDPLAGKTKLVKTPTAQPIRVAMSNSSGFGGANVALVISKI